MVYISIDSSCSSYTTLETPHRTSHAKMRNWQHFGIVQFDHGSLDMHMHQMLEATTTCSIVKPVEAGDFIKVQQKDFVGKGNVLSCQGIRKTPKLCQFARIIYLIVASSKWNVRFSAPVRIYQYPATFSMTPLLNTCPENRIVIILEMAIDCLHATSRTQDAEVMGI